MAAVSISRGVRPASPTKGENRLFPSNKFASVGFGLSMLLVCVGCVGTEARSSLPSKSSLLSVGGSMTATEVPKSKSGLCTLATVMVRLSSSPCSGRALERFPVSVVFSASPDDLGEAPDPDSSSACRLPRGSLLSLPFWPSFWARWPLICRLRTSLFASRRSASH